jgi:hypothetical protein
VGKCVEGEGGCRRAVVVWHGRVVVRVGHAYGDGGEWFEVGCGGWVVGAEMGTDAEERLCVGSW